MSDKVHEGWKQMWIAEGKSVMVKVAVFIAAGLSYVACAVPVTFTGRVSTDLSDAENWPNGVRPGADDIAVVDFAALGGATAISNSTDLAFSGLVLSNTPPSAALWGTNDLGRTTLTFGTNGFYVYRATGANSNLTLHVDFATDGAQAWSFVNERNVYFNGTITGTDTLTMTNDYRLYHNVPPAYGGTIVYARQNVSYHYTALMQVGPWANDVQMPEGRLELQFTGAADWRTVFPGRTLTVGATTLLTLPGVPEISFVDGDSFRSTGGMFVLDKGRLTQTGGSLTAPVQVGYSNYASLYEMCGGTLTSSQLVIGNGNTTSWTTNQEFRISGGTVVADKVHLGWKGASGSLSHSDFTQSGGTVTVTDGTGVDGGLHLGFNSKDATNKRASMGTSGAFRQTGGVFKTPRVAVGGWSNSDSAYWQLQTNSWVSLLLDGGTLDVGSCGFGAVAERWNARETGDTSSTVNSRYRLSLKSGTLAAYDSFTSELDLAIVSNTSPFTVDTRANTVTLAAPLFGSGALEKKGSGTLAIYDGTRHSGKIAVKEGTLKVMGAPSADDTVAGTRCLLWRAEDAVAGLSEGEEITNWVDTAGTRSARYTAVARSKDGANPVTKPTAELSSFNGHPGVKFNQSALTLAAQDNPLGGATNWTICVVLKTDTVGLQNDGAFYLARAVVGREEGGTVDDWALVFSAYGHFGGGMGVKGGTDSCLYTKARNYADGQPHVVFYSLDCTGRRTVVVDGEVCTNSVALNATTKSPRNVRECYFGTHNTVDGTGPKQFAFIGSVAEYRFYPDRALTAGERAGLGATLAAKYGASNAIAATGEGEAQTGELAQTAADAILPDDDAAAWDAESLASLADGAAVASWPSLDGARVADHATGELRMNSQTDLSTETWSKNEPTLVKNALNGHPVVHFSGNEVLGIPASDSPVSGALAWTVAMVFRTTDTTGANPASRQFYMGRALFGAELPLSTRADWGVTFWSEQGRILAGYGGRNVGGDQNVFSRNWDLNDGEPHVLIVSYEPRTGSVDIRVDGVGGTQIASKTSADTPREAMRVQIGMMNCDYGFRGDIAAFRLYGRWLSDAEKESLLAGWNDRFAIPPSSKDAHAIQESGRYGLGAREIEIASGAVFALPVAATSPFTLKDGQRLVVAGTVRGTFAVGAEGVLDLQTSQPETLDGLWLKDGAVLKMDFNQASPIALTSFRAEGTPVIQMASRPSNLPEKFTLFTYAGDATLASNLAWTVEGASHASTIEVANGAVTLVSQVGSLIIFR